MLYKELIVGDNTYKCRLSAKRVIELEDKGINVVQVMTSGEVPSLKNMMHIFHAMIQDYQHGIKFEDVCDIYDNYCAEDKHDQTTFFWFLLKVLQNNGYISRAIDFDAIEEKGLEEARKQVEELEGKN